MVRDKSANSGRLKDPVEFCGALDVFAQVEFEIGVLEVLDLKRVV